MYSDWEGAADTRRGKVRLLDVTRKETPICTTMEGATEIEREKVRPTDTRKQGRYDWDSEMEGTPGRKNKGRSYR